MPGRRPAVVLKVGLSSTCLDSGRVSPKTLWPALGLLFGVAWAQQAPAAEPAPPAPAEAPAAEAVPAAESPPLPAPERAMPGFAELEQAGAIIGQVVVVARDIFDTTDPKENNALFRAANAVHIQTRESVVRRALLFKPGDRVSVRALEETERLLRASNYLYDVRFRPLAWRDGVVDIEVSTRDTWSLDLGVRASRAGGANTTGLKITEHNLLGTGTTLSFGRTNDVDRSSNEIQIANERAFGTWVNASLNLATNSDGRNDSISVVRPFYALDARWAAGVSASRYDRIDPVYNAGEVESQYRHRQRAAEVFGGWSAGLIEGRAQRYSLGLAFQDDAYAVEPGLVAPAQLPADQRLVGPFFGYELATDRYARETNRNLMGRPEFFALGLTSTARLGWASTALGSSENALLYQGSLSGGMEPGPEQTLVASGHIQGRYADGRVSRQQLGGDVQYYLPQGPRWLFYASAAGDLLTNPDPDQTLYLGGDNGLRGYPLRYQNGSRRFLFTVEERFYTDIFLWQLFRIGGAAFYDVGRAWGEGGLNTVNPGWLHDLGFGLRIVSARSAFGNVIHVDVAVPLNATPDIQKVQLIVKTKTAF